MIDEIWKLMDEAIDGERARENALRINEHARWCHFEAMQRTAEATAQLMREAGLEQVELIETPADGKTSFGGWVNPEAVAIEDATLEIVEPRVRSPVLARYRREPCSLMVYSKPTPPEGVRAELVAVEKGNRPSAYRGREVRGKIVLIDGSGITYGESAFDRGALGLISDAVPTDEFIRPASVMANTRRWHNYTVPPWKTKSKGFGFSITPKQGRRLRRLLGEHARVVLRAVVRGRYYDGKLNVVTGLLPGETGEQIALTGHLYEWGADDNASGCGLAIEIARATRTLTAAGKIARPRRGLRLMFGMEIRGTNAYQALHPSARQLVAGVNIDMVGCEQLQSRVMCLISNVLPSNPGYAVPLILHLAERLRAQYPYFRYRLHRGPEFDDNGFGEPMFGAPCPVVCQMPAPHHHSSLDVPENLSPRMLSLMGTMFGSYALFLAKAEYAEAHWLAELTYESARQRIMDECRKWALADQPGSVGELAERFAFLGDVARRQVRSIARLAPRVRERIQDHQQFQPEQIDEATGLTPDRAVRKHVADLGERLVEFTKAQCEDLRSRTQLKTGSPRAPKRLSSAAQRIAFRKAFPGYLGWEFLAKRKRRRVLADLGMDSMVWNSPEWTQSALFWSNGRRSVYDVWRKVRCEGHRVDLAKVTLLLETLTEHGLVERVPTVTRGKLARALRAAGVRAGDVIFVHASLSRFGYFLGGADAMIDGLLDAIGEQGTLVMPTFTFSFVGWEPFDRKASPSQVGFVTETFRRRPGAVRSSHPTHSVAALGPRAAEICRGHTCRKPVFAEQGPFGKLLALDAKIVMLARPLASTMLHMGEQCAGLPWQDCQVAIVRKGKVEHVLARQLPYHSDRSGAYDRLESRGQIRRARLGLEDVQVMRARDAVQASTEVFERDPLLATYADCECAHCRAIRQHAKRETGVASNRGET